MRPEGKTREWTRESGILSSDAFPKLFFFPMRTSLFSFSSPQTSALPLPRQEAIHPTRHQLLPQHYQPLLPSTSSLSSQPAVSPCFLSTQRRRVSSFFFFSFRAACPRSRRERAKTYPFMNLFSLLLTSRERDFFNVVCAHAFVERGKRRGHTKKP